MYIRTKDGIVEVKTIADVQTKVIYKDNLIAQADTIEELCDTLIHFKKEFLPLTHNYYGSEKMLSNILKRLNDNENIRLGIWTSKGLIYVAKLIDGELVLI